MRGHRISPLQVPATRTMESMSLSLFNLLLQSFTVSYSTCCLLLLHRLVLTGRDMGRMFFLPMPGDREWTRAYVVQYLRPCVPDEVPSNEDIIGKPLACDTASMLQLNKKSDIFYMPFMNVQLDKGKWHMVHFWGNDYTEKNSFPTKSPIFYPCYLSLKDRKKIFTHTREQKEPYTGKVQDWDFRLGSEVFDDGERKQKKGKRLTQESWERVLKFARIYKKKIK